MSYLPLNYDKINLVAGSYNPSMIKNYNNQVYSLWERALFQRACSSIIIENFPEEWRDESIQDFLYYCLFRFGFVCMGESIGLGKFFQPCTLKGYNFYYQPTDCVIANPLYSATLTIGKDCELIKMTPDYAGVWETISYYAEKLAILDNAINISLINTKYAFMIGAKTKAAAEAIKKMMDKINKGEPAVVYDQRIQDDPNSKSEPWQIWERKDIASGYITDKQLADFQTILNAFDNEIGIPTVPYQKKERMVQSEAESKALDATSRATVWVKCLQGSFRKANEHYGTKLSARLRFVPEQEVKDGK